MELQDETSRIQWNVSNSSHLPVITESNMTYNTQTIHPKSNPNTDNLKIANSEMASVRLKLWKIRNLLLVASTHM